MVRPGWPLALLAYVVLGAYEMRPGDRITPSLVLYRAIATLLDWFGRLQRVLSALVLDRIVGDERVSAAFDLAGTFHCYLSASFNMCRPTSGSTQLRSSSRLFLILNADRSMPSLC